MWNLAIFDEMAIFDKCPEPWYSQNWLNHVEHEKQFITLYYTTPEKLTNEIEQAYKENKWLTDWPCEFLCISKTNFKAYPIYELRVKNWAKKSVYS